VPRFGRSGRRGRIAVRYRVHLAHPANSVAVRLSHLACGGAWRNPSVGVAPPLGRAIRTDDRERYIRRVTAF